MHKPEHDKIIIIDRRAIKDLNLDPRALVSCLMVNPPCLVVLYAFGLPVRSSTIPLLKVFMW